MKIPRMILASASPRRAELLHQVVEDFEIVNSSAEEVWDSQLSAGEVARVNAYRKARAVAKRFPDALVLGADTVVEVGERLLGKPSDQAMAERMLEALQGREHRVVTGVCLLQLRGHHQRVFAESTSVWFRELDGPKIRTYLSTINPLDKAGGYAIQENGEMLVSDVVGSYTNVVGLPVERLREELVEWAHWELGEVNLS